MELTLVELQPQIQALLPELIAFRRNMHMHPELGKQEKQTSRLIYDVLQAHGVECSYVYENRGVKALISGEFSGEDIVLRSDMDALPVAELTDLPFKSVNDNVMHACGHDMNTSYLLGAVIILHNNRKRLHGRVQCIFQCAEETLNGAREAIDAGVMDGIRPRFQFALHTNSEIRAGRIAIKQGNAMTASATLGIKVKGKGGHAAYPHLTVDPISISAAIISNLQALVARRHHPADPLVITIGSIHGGSAANITPNEVHMLGTVRYFNMDLGMKLKEMVVSTCCKTAEALGGTCEVDFQEKVPAIVCTRDIFEYAYARLSRIGDNVVSEQEYPSMGSEDFALFRQFGPVMQIRIGTRNEAPSSSLPLHNPGITFSEDSIPYGIMAACTLAGL